MGGKGRKPAEPTDCKIEPLPARRTTVRLDRVFSPDEMDCIRMGFVPMQMEDKWFIYWKDNCLFFHRSWTGFCIYVVRFIAEGETWRMIEADVNRDPRQYKVTDDDLDAGLISYLVDVLLLRRQAAMPAPEGSSAEKNALMMWSLVGRAMLGQHPDDA